MKDALTTIGSILGPMGALVVGWLVYRQSKASQRDTVVLETGKLAVAEGQLAVEEKAANLAELAKTVEILSGEVERVQAGLEHERQQRKLSNGYARTLAQIIRDEGIAVPPPPEGLDLP